MDRKKNIIVGLFIALITLSCGIVGVVQFSYRVRIVQTEDIQSRPVALVLGASLKRGAPNGVLEDRLVAAKELYDAKKVQKLIVSGDNRTFDHNEPEAMKRFLVSRGVPIEDIVLDYAGQRTYDSCYRLRDIFAQRSVIIVTQYFHLPRALYLCNSLGVDAVGVAAEQKYRAQWWSAYFREFFASLRAWIDVMILKPMPILGKQEKVF